MNNFQYRLKMFMEEESPIKWFATGIILYIYGYFLRLDLFALSQMENARINVWDFVINFSSDIHLILYFITPVLLLSSLKNIQGEFNYFLLIRLGSYHKWIVFTLIKFMRQQLLMFTVLFIITMLLIISIPIENNWSNFSGITEGIPLSFPANILSSYIGHPVVALFLHIILFFMTYTSLHLLLGIIFLLTKKISFSIIAAVLFWLLSIISFKWFTLDFSLFVLPNYMTYFHGVNSFGNTWTSFLIEFIILAFLLFLSTKVDKKPKINLEINLKYVIYVVLVWICLLSGLQRNSLQSIEDVFISIFFGTSTEGTTFISLLTYIVIFYGFTYLIHLYLNNEINNLGYYKILRYNSINEWMLKNFFKVLISISFLLVGLLIIILVLARFLGLRAFDSSLDAITLMDILYHFFINGYLQIVFYILLSFIIAWITKEMFYGFIVQVFLLIFLIPGLNPYQIIPSGLNSMGYLLDDVSPYKISIILLFYIIAEIVILYNLLNKTDFNMSK
ncbi:hypothetical protein JNUCC74_01830 [Cerasibacillus sp. JNUCC 74]